MHQDAFAKGMTCIDCHQGIAHALPDDYLTAYRGVVERLQAEGAIPAPKPVDAAALDGYLKTTN